MKYKLDLYILYLRRAFYTCYYSASVNSSVEEVERRSINYLRRLPTPSILVPVLGSAEKKKASLEEEGEEEGEERKKDAEETPMVVEDDDADVAVFDEVEEAKGGKDEIDPVLKDRKSHSSFGI